MSKFDRSFKKQYVVISTRISDVRGPVTVLYDKNNEFYLVGIGLTLDNVKEGGPYGVRRCYTKEDAMNEMSSLMY